MIVISTSLRSDFIHMAGMTIHVALESTIHIVGIRNQRDLSDTGPCESFAEFVKCYGADSNGQGKRKPGDSKDDRWHSFHIDEVRKRDYKIDSLKWLRDDALNDGDGLLEPDEIATNAIADFKPPLRN
jgi:hypothetical protein